MKSILVIGMGTFGTRLATKMMELKNEVMIIDKDEELIEELAGRFTDAQIGDCTKESVLLSLGVNNFDICFVTIGENFQSSLEITSLLKDLGAKYVVSKAKKDIQVKFLLRNGADEVIYPEKEVAERLAIRHSANNVFDYVQLSPDYAIYEIPILANWISRSISSLDIRTKYHVNILAVKNEGQVHPLPYSNYIFKEKDHIIVVGKHSDIKTLTSKM